jgi:hypothetical protein
VFRSLGEVCFLSIKRYFSIKRRKLINLILINIFSRRSVGVNIGCTSRDQQCYPKCWAVGPITGRLRTKRTERCHQPHAFPVSVARSERDPDKVVGRDQGPGNFMPLSPHPRSAEQRGRQPVVCQAAPSAGLPGSEFAVSPHSNLTLRRAPAPHTYRALGATGGPPPNPADQSERARTRAPSFCTRRHVQSMNRCRRITPRSG